jgi:DNA replication and repair protein RecF
MKRPLPAIRALILAQFRSHARTELSLDGRPVVLHGPNGAGKTNVLEAISLLSPGRGLRRAKADELARAPGSHGWRIRAEIATAGGLRAVTLGADPEGRKSLEIDGKAGAQTALGHIAPMLWLTPPMDRLWLEGAEGRRRFLDRAALSFFPSHAEAALTYEKAMRERNRLLREETRDTAWLTTLEARMAESGAALARARIAAGRRLLAAQDAAKTLFPHAQIAIIGDMETRIADAAPQGSNSAAETAAAWLATLEARMAGSGAALARARIAAGRRLLAAQEAAKTLFPHAQIAIIGDMETRIADAATQGSDSAAETAAAWLRETLARGRDRDAAAGRTLAGPHRTDMTATYAEKAMEARHCSTGEQKALLISLVLANARALARESGSAPILLLDEVAAHLDADRRAALFDEICALRAQAWMTGVGPELFDALGERAQTFAVAESADGSAVTPAP